jgi:SAM-dependent methyltransferase
VVAEDVGTGTVVNREMAAAWDGEEGEDWAREWKRYDRASAGHHRVLLDAAAIGVSDHVLDIGCGNGQVSRDAARAAPAGSVVGVDLSSRMLERARALARQEGLGNVRFEQADAQVHAFEPGAYDVALSRFGVMFFADRVAAFANIGTALRPGGRLAMVAWRELGDNEWVHALLHALALGRRLPVPPPGSPGPFGLADAEGVDAALTAAGFDAVDITAVDRPVWLGADADDAFTFIRGSGFVRGMTQGLDGADRARALDAARAVIAAHDTGDGVRFGSGAWLIVARHP